MFSNFQVYETIFIYLFFLLKEEFHRRLLRMHRIPKDKWFGWKSLKHSVTEICTKTLNSSSDFGIRIEEEKKEQLVQQGFIRDKDHRAWKEIRRKESDAEDVLSHESKTKAGWESFEKKFVRIWFSGWFARAKYDSAISISLPLSFPVLRLSRLRIDASKRSRVGDGTSAYKGEIHLRITRRAVTCLAVRQDLSSLLRLRRRMKRAEGEEGWGVGTPRSEHRVVIS